MSAAPDDGFSFDPKTWVRPPEPEAVAPPASTPTRRGGRAALAAGVSALLLLGGAAAAYLTRTPATAGATAATPR